MRILHLDAGREMRGGQWQVLRLIEGLASRRRRIDAAGARRRPLFADARKRGWRVEPLGLMRAVKHARRHDLMHAHDARTHTLARDRPRRAAGGRAPRRVSDRHRLGSREMEVRARAPLHRGLGICQVGADRGGVPAEKISVVYDGVPVLDRAGDPRGRARSSPLRKRARPSPRGGAPRRRPASTLAADLEQDLRQRVDVRLHHAQRRPRIGRAAGDVGRRAGDREQSRRTARRSCATARPDCWSKTMPQAIAAAIRELLDDPDLAREPRRRGRPRGARTIHRRTHGPPYDGGLPAGARLIEAMLALLFGLLIGSFLNVCIHRWPRGRSVVRPRSHCVRCRKIDRLVRQHPGRRATCCCAAAAATAASTSPRAIPPSSC